MGSRFSLFYADLVQIVESTVGVANYSLCFVFGDKDKSEFCARPPNFKERSSKRRSGLPVCFYAEVETT